MENLILDDTWFGAESMKDGKPVIVRGRQFLKNFIDSGEYPESIEVTWTFRNRTTNGIPTIKENSFMGEIEDSLVKFLEFDKQSILTIVHTCDNQRTWIFYTKSTLEFGGRLNEALSDFDVIPISIESDDDPEWDLYKGILNNYGIDVT